MAVQPVTGLCMRSNTRIQAVKKCSLATGGGLSSTRVKITVKKKWKISHQFYMLTDWIN